MKTYPNDYLFSKNISDKPHLQRPDSCGKCIHRNDCHNWKTCPVINQSKPKYEPLIGE